jgi:hypothetical protein
VSQAITGFEDIDALLSGRQAPVAIEIGSVRSSRNVHRLRSHGHARLLAAKTMANRGDLGRVHVADLQSSDYG